MSVGGSGVISLIGVPMDLGADRRGVDMGPGAIRHAGLCARLENNGYTVRDEGDISVTRLAQAGENKLKYLDEIVRVNNLLADVVSGAMAAGHFPVILGGDHSIAIGTVAGVLRHKHRLGVIWFDAHGDINTPDTTPSGNIHGMPAAVCLGQGHGGLLAIGGGRVRAENFVMVGIRDLDRGEKDLLRQLGVNVFTMHEIDLLGIDEVLKRGMALANQGTDGVHVSFDMDAVDPLHAPGVGTPVLGGLTFRESHFAMELLWGSHTVCSAEFVEVNTVLDNRNQTARIAVSLISSLLGERLL